MEERLMKGHGPMDPQRAPDITGITTFLRLPHLSNLTGVDLAIVGLPLDARPGERAGTGGGPRAVREASLALRPFHNPAQRVEVFARLSCADHGDAPVVVGSAEESLAAMQEVLAGVHAAGAVPLGLGGDRAVLLAELRAAAERHGPLALTLFAADAEATDGGEPRGHGAPLRRALDEGLVDARRSTLLGPRGGTDGPDDRERLRAEGFAVFTWDELAQLGTGAAAAAVERARGAAFLSFDLGFVDPAFAPGVGAPVVGGPSSAQALALLRGCRGLEIVGADVVEVDPDLDHVRLTATLAATIAWEIMSLVACFQDTTTGPGLARGAVVDEDESS